MPLVYKIALGMIPGVGDITARKLVSYTGSVEAVFNESFRNLMRIPGIGEAIASVVAGHEYLPAAEREADFVERNKTRMTTTRCVFASARTRPLRSTCAALQTSMHR